MLGLPGPATIPDALTAFRQAVLASSGLLDRLGAIEMPDVFEAEAAAVAAEIGIALPTYAISGQHAPTELDCWPRTGWLPVRSANGGSPLLFDWAWFGGSALVEPFYGDSVRRMAARPLSRALRPRTGLDSLVAGAAAEETLAPQGFIFHMSRCGSTLAAQMLAAVPHHVVISEAEPIDGVVKWAGASGAGRDAQITAMRAIVSALGRKRSDAARRYFVKLDSWHVHALPLFHAAFPDVPWIFLYREPEEVMVSQSRIPGLHFAAAMAPAKAQSEPGMPFSLEDSGARVLAGFLHAAAEHQSLGNGKLINYPDLAHAMESEIPAHFGFAPDAEERRLMSAAKSRNAKAPGERFVADSGSKRAAVTPAIAAAVGKHLREPYERLEELRMRLARTQTTHGL